MLIAIAEDYLRAVLDFPAPDSKVRAHLTRTLLSASKTSSILHSKAVQYAYSCIPSQVLNLPRSAARLDRCTLESLDAWGRVFKDHPICDSRSPEREMLAEMETILSTAQQMPALLDVGRYFTSSQPDTGAQKESSSGKACIQC